MKEMTKVLVVDDAAFMVNALREILESDPDVEVVGTARNGKDALEKIKDLQPDVVTLDVDMPVMDGIKTIRHVMIESPVPIVMLSSLFNHGDITFEALRLGVVDFLPKPSGAISRDIHQQGNRITERVKIAAAEKIENVRRVKLAKIEAGERMTELYGYKMLDYMIALGTSLGGPNTIIRILSRLSPDLPAAIVVIQEIMPNILPEFVNEFNAYTPWRVEVGRKDRQVEPGVCYICSNQEPLIVKVNSNQEVYLADSNNPQRPLDALFASVAESFEKNAIAVLLTGVGDDGRNGFSKVREMSGVTIVQKAETCVYPNLTQCAIEAGVVDIIADADDLPEHIESAIRSGSVEDEMVMP